MSAKAKSSQKSFAEEARKAVELTLEKESQLTEENFPRIQEEDYGGKNVVDITDPSFNLTPTFSNGRFFLCMSAKTIFQRLLREKVGDDVGGPPFCLLHNMIGYFLVPNDPKNALTWLRKLKESLRSISFIELNDQAKREILKKEFENSLKEENWKEVEKSLMSNYSVTKEGEKAWYLPEDSKRCKHLKERAQEKKENLIPKLASKLITTMNKTIEGAEFPGVAKIFMQTRFDKWNVDRHQGNKLFHLESFFNEDSNYIS